MKPITRQIAMVGLVVIALSAIGASVCTSSGEYIAVVSTTVVGIVGVLKTKEDDE